MIEAALARHARETPDAPVVNVNTPETVPKPPTTLQAQNNTNIASTVNRPPTPDIGLSKVTYTVQRNDNLWTIANQIARRNRVDVATVMAQIQQYNPDAFIDGDAKLLKANAKLTLPDYEVIPSRLGIRAATRAKRSSSGPAARPSAPRRATPARPRRNTAPRPVPRANVTLVTPGTSGSATGNANGGLSRALSNQVQETRRQTANEARRVVGLNSQLTDYTHKLQLQNQRLNDLEIRLKELRRK